MLIGVAGTATTLAAAELGLKAWDSRAVHGSQISKIALSRWTQRLVGPDLAEREAMIQVSPERANTVLAGACILLRICEAAKVEVLRISVGGIRQGLLHNETRAKA